MNRLFIIGNGFDLKHRLPSRYEQFGKFCSLHFKQVYTTMQSFFTVPEDTLWSDFENSLGKINEEKLKQEYDQAVQNRTLKDNYLINVFPRDLQHAFKEWIVSLKNLTPDLSPSFVFDTSDVFISFNYTDVLETLYHVKKQNILHIHEYANPGQETELYEGYIYGHGKDELHCTECLESWEDVRCFFINGLRKQYQQGVIPRFLKKHLTNCKKIFVWGHSMDSIDDYYFKEIQELCQNAQITPDWFIYYFNEMDSDKKIESISRLHINNHHLIRM